MGKTSLPTPPPKVTGTMGVRIVGNILGYKKLGVNETLHNSRVQAVLGRKDLSFLKQKLALKSSTINRKQMIDIMKRVRDKVFSPLRPPGLNNINFRAMRRRPIAVYTELAAEPGQRRIKQEAVERGRQEKEEIEKNREERRRGLVSGRPADERTDLPLRTALPQTPEEAHKDALRRINVIKEQNERNPDVRRFAGERPTISIFDVPAPSDRPNQASGPDRTDSPDSQWPKPAGNPSDENQPASDKRDLNLPLQ